MIIIAKIPKIKIAKLMELQQMMKNSINEKYSNKRN